MDYEQAVEDFYRSILRPGDIAVDCGAHTGRHTVPMSDIVGGGGRVYAFEPLPWPFKTLSEKCASRGNVTLDNCAVGQSSGKAPFIFVPDFPEYSGFEERTYHDETIARVRTEVRVKRLDDAIPTLPLVRYIKIDAEGGDLKILRGAEKLLRFSRPYVTFECGDNSTKNYDYTSADYFDFLNRIGYRISTITGEQLDRAAFIESNKVQSVWDYIATP
ncbi:FkbM family methyltransferase [Mesorhizobium sp.]|uniref:FkbM family methyltransferase n=1 Tax=Mesorhizobium sp. TaxID=1871066 RepID=UPI001225A579|nr:FkbM family methyltransferase [Mesorhizobium sp.]TIN83092.1 MAG: FkbM family methyltransferase [Mesorhizobium sp.]